MRTATVVAIILIGLGILSLAYFASPVRLLFQETVEQQEINTVPLFIGGVTLIGGIALLVAVRLWVNKGER